MRKVVSLLGMVAVSLLICGENVFCAWEPTAAPDSSTYALYYSAPYLYAGMSHGAFRSSDQGVTWTPCGFLGIRVSVFVANANRLYAGTIRNGIFVSDDQGNLWTKFALDTLTVHSITFNGADIFAGTENGGRLYISHDGGQTWSSKTIAHAFDQIRSIIIQGSRIVASTGSGTQVSQDYGTTWRPLGHLFGGPTAGLVTTGGHFLGGDGSGIFKSLDGGVSWARMLNCPIVGPMINTGSVVFAASEGGGGVFASFNNGHSWTSFNKGLENLQVYGIAASDSFLFAGRAISDNVQTVAGVWRRNLSDLIGIIFCGDVDVSGFVNVSDVVKIISHVLNGQPLTCPLRVADVNCDGFISMSDAVTLINAVFSGYIIECRSCSP